MLRPGCGGGAKSKGALYRETLQTTGFYVGRIVIVTREFTPIPSPPLRCRRFRESRSLPGMRLGRQAQSIGPMGSNYSRTGPPYRLPLVGPVDGVAVPRVHYEVLSPTPFICAERFKNARALVMRFFRHGGIYRSDVSSHLINLVPGSRFTVGSGPGYRTRRKNTPCPSSAMSSGRLFLDRVARQHCPSPLHRHTQITMHSQEAQVKGDVSTLPGRGHFYFALTSGIPQCRGKVEMSYLGKVEMSYCPTRRPAIPSLNIVFHRGPPAKAPPPRQTSRPSSRPP